MKRAPIHQFIKELKKREAAPLTESREVVAFESQPSLAPVIDVAQTEERPAPQLRTIKLPTREDFIKSTEELIDEIKAREVAAMDGIAGLTDPELDLPLVGISVPLGWIKGQLLNIRNNGAEYVITVLGEEFDPRYPERALRISNPVECQNFVSKWYARENHDPRAY